MTASAPETEALHSVALHQGIQQRIAMREGDIVDKLVLAFRSGKATSDVMLAAVAAISELRALEDSLDRAARVAIDEANRRAAG